MTLTNNLQTPLRLACIRLALVLTLVISASPLSAYAQTLKRGFAWPFQISSLDPQKISSDTLLVVTQHFLATLVTIDKDDKIQPSLAKSWQFDEQGKLLTFFLREDAVWSDGTAIDARTVEKSMLRALSDQTTSDAKVLLWFLKQDKATLQAGSNSNIKVRDDFTISFVVDAIDSKFVRTFSNPITAPLPLQQLNSEQLFPKDITLLSSGPYQLLPRTIDSKLSFVANDKYFGPTPHYKEVLFEFNDYELLIEKYLQQQLDILEYIPHSQKEWLEIYYPKQVVSRNYGGIYLLFDKNLHGKHAKTIRQSLISVLDQQTLFAVSKVDNKHFSPSGLVYFESNGYKQLPLASNYKISVEAALQNMRDAGYDENNRLKLCVTQTNIKFVELMNYIRSQWASMFVDVNFVEAAPIYLAPSSFYIGKEQTCNIALIGYAVRLKTEEEIFDAIFEDGAGLPSTHIKQNEKLRAKYQQIKSTTDKQKRLLLVAELEKMILENYSALMISKVQNTSLVKPHVKNYVRATRRNFITYSQYLR